MAHLRPLFNICIKFQPKSIKIISVMGDTYTHTFETNSNKYYLDWSDLNQIWNRTTTASLWSTYRISAQKVHNRLSYGSHTHAHKNERPWTTYLVFRLLWPKSNTEYMLDLLLCHSELRFDRFSLKIISINKILETQTNF